MSKDFTIGDTVTHPDYGVGTFLGVIEKGSMITVFGDTFPNPSTLLRVIFAGGVRMALSPEHIYPRCYATRGISDHPL